MTEFHDIFLDGNEIIAKAIREYRTDSSEENLTAVLEAIRLRMHADGHFLFPVLMDEQEEGRFAFRTVRTQDGKVWNAAFTSEEEYAKGEPSQVMSYFIDSSMRFCMESGSEGFIIDPWGQSFLLTNEQIGMIFRADGDTEYSVPDDPVTREFLEDGSFLKKAIEICNRNRTQLNLVKLFRILRDSRVWIPCNAVLSDVDLAAMEKAVRAAADSGDLETLAGTEFTTKDTVRMIPDILQSGEEFFFPVFTAAEEMGEYGERFSKVEQYFPEAIHLAANNEKNVCGIVINAFSEPFVIPREMFDLIVNMESGLADDADPA